MIKQHIAYVAGLLMCVLCACTEKESVDAVGRPGNKTESTGQVAKKTHAALMQEIDTANNTCRGMPGMSKESVEACDKRDQLMAEAENAGLCWGPQDVSGAEKHWIRCSDDPSFVKAWYSHDLNHANCIESGSPAAKMRLIMDAGKQPKVLDLPNGTVEVQDEMGNGRTVVWTFYGSMESCTKSLPRSKTIDKKYE